MNWNLCALSLRAWICGKIDSGHHGVSDEKGRCLPSPSVISLWLLLLYLFTVDLPLEQHLPVCLLYLVVYLGDWEKKSLTRGITAQSRINSHSVNPRSKLDQDTLPFGSCCHHKQFRDKACWQSTTSLHLHHRVTINALFFYQSIYDQCVHSYLLFVCMPFQPLKFRLAALPKSPSHFFK